ncbi:rifin PIR protein, putative [Plasmodium reichenowi]|uniref:Rifin PIR protein, putative n=1 Tax=Plasmodium reichenowi TaxID=5854 RepID=A0A2P9DBC3_PLARE|nr:rifin PIR protein, putative [Plasmodium reichenowi]
MKVHYINILLFALLLDILVNDKRNHKNRTLHTPKIPTTRSLCECELYAPVNYDNDPQMKKIMENFNKQTQQRLHEYDEHMVEKRKQYKDKCDKEIQKIILKDKLEKQMAQQFATLHTDMQNDAIPTCICEKSLADKSEKFCLNCGRTMGGVAPGWGLVGGLMYEGWTNYVSGIVAKAATKAGIEATIQGVKTKFSLDTLGGQPLAEVITTELYKKPTLLVGNIVKEYYTMCENGTVQDTVFGLYDTGLPNHEQMVIRFITVNSNNVATNAGEAAKTVAATETAKFVPKTTILTNTIIASIIAIVVIVLIMVIIYLILRYRRKKKMKKKLQYIKLLEE